MFMFKELHVLVLFNFTARVTGVIVVALNSTAVNVSWTPVTLLDTEYHYTVHYTGVKGTKLQSFSGERFICYFTLSNNTILYRFSECLSWLILWCGWWTDDW